MKIRFWGVRGSIASPGRDTALVGGNTSCVELACGDARIVLDGGTGLRALGNHLVASGATREPLAMTLLLSHYHWDHIQGLPFFIPISRRTLRVRSRAQPVRNADSSRHGRSAKCRSRS